MASFTLLVPSIAESISTGLLMAGERSYRGKIWRAEIRSSGVRVLCDGAPQSTIPDHAAKLARDVASYVQTS